MHLNSPTFPKSYKDTKNKFKVHLIHRLPTVNFGYSHTRNTETLCRNQFCKILSIEKQLPKFEDLCQFLKPKYYTI